MWCCPLLPFLSLWPSLLNGWKHTYSQCTRMSLSWKILLFDQFPLTHPSAEKRSPLIWKMPLKVIYPSVILHWVPTSDTGQDGTSWEIALISIFSWESSKSLYNLIQTLDQARDQSSTLQEGRKWSCRWFDCGREIKGLWNGSVAVKCKQGFSDWWLEHLTMPRQMFRNDDQGQLLWQLQPRWWWWW